MANIALADLDFDTQASLTRVLDRLEHRVLTGAGPVPSTAEIVFCDGDDVNCCAHVRALRVSRPELPVVVVTRHPEMSKWLDALDAGASDYCSAPFETVQVAWLLSAVLEHSSQHQQVTAVP